METLMLQRLLIGFSVNLIFGIIAFMTEMVDDMGFFGGVVIFTLLYVFLDWQGYVIILAFFSITGLAIQLENKEKAEKGEFELYKAKRPIERVLGRSLAGVIFGAMFFVTNRPEYKFAFVASYATEIFDTVSTKLGKILSKEAVLITNFKKVRHGTPGGISIQGTIFGLISALLVSAAGFITQLLTTFEQLLIVLMGAFIGSTIDSYLNAYSHQNQKRHVPNEFINFFSSMSAGIACIWIQWIFNTVLGVRMW